MVLLAVFITGRLFFDVDGRHDPNDFRIAIIHILQMTYGATAYAYLLMSARTTTEALAPVAGHLPHWNEMLHRAGKHRSVVLVLIVLMLPLQGIRMKIRLAKDRELDWCRVKLQESRAQLKTGSGGGLPLAEVLAYRTLVEDIRNWPFDNPTLTRFMLYLLIPLGSWLGGAFVERGVDLFLS